MTDNIYYLEDYADLTIPVATDDGSGTDWLIITGTYAFQFNSWGAFINLGQTSPLSSLAGYVTYPDLVTVHHNAIFYGQIENAQGGGGSEEINGSDIANILVGDPTDVAGAGDQIFGKAGADTILGGGGGDNLFGGADNDLIFGDNDPNAQGATNLSQGDDSLYGGNGNDTLSGGQGSNLIDGGAGYDTADYSGFFDDFGNFTYRTVINLQTNTATVYAYDIFAATESVVASDTLTGIEVVIGSNGNDVIYGEITFGPGDFTNNELHGGLGNDTLWGGPGADALYGGDGNDTLADYGNTLPSGSFDVLNGGAGDDYYMVSNATTRIVETATGGYDRVAASVDYVLPTNVEALILAPAFSDVHNGTGNGSNNQIEGNFVTNLLIGLAGNDNLFGFGADDTLNGGGGLDSLYGGTENDQLNGSSQNDFLSGDGGADSLYGGSDDDSLSGGSQNDLLQGGTGSDVLRGGKGADAFVFAKGETSTGTSRDRIADFQSGQDHIDLHQIMAGQIFIEDSGFHRIAGEVRYDSTTGILSGDTNGDHIADYQIALGAGTLLVAGDLIL